MFSSSWPSSFFCCDVYDNDDDDDSCVNYNVGAFVVFAVKLMVQIRTDFIWNKTCLLLVTDRTQNNVATAFATLAKCIHTYAVCKYHVNFVIVGL